MKKALMILMCVCAVALLPSCGGKGGKKAKDGKVDLDKVAEKMMKEACRKYKDVYFVHPNASAAHESSVDGTHPDDYGYYLWARSIEKPVLRILRKYGIK